MSQIISATALRGLVDSRIAFGQRVVGPRRVKDGLVLYQSLAAADQLLLRGFVHPRNSIKEVVFPRHETLYSYRLQGKQIELRDAELPSAEQIVIGARPCDAASLPIIDLVENWDFRDSLYSRRRELTTVVTLVCREWDAHCFCTSVGVGPGCESGSDALLIDLGDETYEVRCLSEKGKQLFSGHTEQSERQGQIPAGPAPTLDIAAVRQFLAGNFESPQWQTLARRCLDCGACAYSCPTCHCFDVVDEGNAAGGIRARNWDACQFAMFTAHASGHNPRGAQPQRQRQRIYHKFLYYPEKFGPLLCTGCGNCSRNCPVGLGVRPVLESIAP